ncbi:hypothetical protein HanXRQr2_Chr17g0800501 [Helianthus annuus]|uniref:Uncharacterized protein n=1 Tax=Helianthus annuus TaxID=4232 RepID=A0A251RP70_HELAN|nr:hypothetical protein HanXRQr2_Chr17g0800501 [Helianthus annuus]KAJ0812976.1 hypothetical protein HanPSC8_Chr17g0768141 [Helianthus annuus]
MMFLNERVQEPSRSARRARLFWFEAILVVVLWRSSSFMRWERGCKHREQHVRVTPRP